MKTITTQICIAVLLCMTCSLRGQVIDVSQYRQTVYQQTGPAPTNVTLRTPQGYYFFSVLDADPSKALEYSPFMVYTPSLLVSNHEFFMVENSTYYSTYYGNFFDTKSNLDAAFPSGAYDYVTTYSDPNDNKPKSDNAIITVPEVEYYSTNLPAFSASCWNSMRHVDPSGDFTLSWNAYQTTTGAAYALTFANAYDSQTLDATYGSFYYSGQPNVNSTVIPAGTLDYGRTYVVGLYFSNRSTPAGATNTDGSPITVALGYDTVTETTLTTIPPPLLITLADSTDVTLTWPTQATNYVLQSALSLNCPGCWTNVTSLPDQNNGTNSVTLPTIGSQAYFRLSPL